MNWRAYFRLSKANPIAPLRCGHEEEMYQAFKARLLEELVIMDNSGPFKTNLSLRDEPANPSQEELPG